MFQINIVNNEETILNEVLGIFAMENFATTNFPARNFATGKFAALHFAAQSLHTIALANAHFLLQFK